MIDSHCHLDCSAFDADRDAVVARAEARGVTRIIVPAVDEASWQAITSLAVRVPACRPCRGIHPVALPAMPSHDDEAVIGRLSAALGSYRPIAIGECGLDTTIDLNLAPLDRQERLLSAQLALARSFDLPVILHARGPHCYAKLLDFLERENLPKRGGVLHSYGGGADLLRGFLDHPLMFGFAGPATYRSAPKVRASIKRVPPDRLLAETDAPDQTPEPHRPGRSEPAYVADVIRGLATILAEPSEAITEQTSANARRLFDLA